MVARKNGILYGVCFNDADYHIKKTKDRKTIWTCPYYKTWQAMVNRCFSEKYKQKFPTYEGTTCFDEWKYFSKFKAWMETQDWEGKVLDKDLLSTGSKEYNPDNCVFISPALNSFLTFCNAKRGEWPVGVSFRQEERTTYSKPFVACISMQGRGNKTLGYRSTPLEAHMLWVAAKIENLQEFKTSSDIRVLHGISLLEEKLKECLKNNKEFKV